MAILMARTESASARLREAIRLDFAHYLSRQVEDRLRARPHFFGRSSELALTLVREKMETEAERVTASLEQPVVDLRVYYGASPRSEAEEASGFGNALAADIAKCAERILSRFGVPGDDKPDDPDQTGLDLDATYDVTYTPSPTVLWAWRQVRALDEVRNLIVDAGDCPPKPTFELRWHLPELLVEAAKKN